MVPHLYDAVSQVGIELPYDTPCELGNDWAARRSSTSRVTGMLYAVCFDPLRIAWDTHMTNVLNVTMSTACVMLLIYGCSGEASTSKDDDDDGNPNTATSNGAGGSGTSGAGGNGSSVGGSGSMGGNSSVGGGNGMTSAGGSAQTMPCVLDCTAITTPACLQAVCNDKGDYPGPLGECVVIDEPDGGICDDDLFCTILDRCQAGVCVGGAPNDCGMSCAPGSCNEINKTCSC